MMTEVFDKLRTLQDILSEKFAIEKEIIDIPKSLTTKNELVNRLKKSYIEKNDRLQEIQKRIRRLRQNLAEAETQRETYEKQMDLIKTQREYEALDKEISDATEKEQHYRKEIISEEKNAEEIQLSLEKEEQLINQQETELQEEKERIKNESEEKQHLLKKLSREEAEVTPGLDEDILFKFERIIRSKAGLGIVPVRGKECTGCRMILPAQFVNDVRSGDDVRFCPYCSRILYFQEKEDDVMTFRDEDAGSLADLVDLDEISAD